MRPSVFLILLGAGRTLGASYPHSPSYSSYFPSSPSPPLLLPSSLPSSLGFSQSKPIPPYSSSLPASSLVSSSSVGGSGISPTTQSLLSGIPVSSYAFVPVPSPSSEPPIPGVYPLASPDTPPPVDTPALVPDFASAWSNVYEKARAKVSDLFGLFCVGISWRATHQPHASRAKTYYTFERTRPDTVT
jgi:hypothetical protein